jgi:hypothetical protein
MGRGLQSAALRLRERRLSGAVLERLACGGRRVPALNVLRQLGRERGAEDPRRHWVGMRSPKGCTPTFAR